MSLSTSKSKTQLAYVSKYIFYTFLGSGKAITKPKNKSTNPTENNDNTKSKNNTKSSSNNIY